ncbi:hypothetical protein KGF57_000689 [Candida theae]|uniref:Uncharacterized protein n=1 Tax=Candida theae TaxID=1198502 RepID=A0AAD5G0D9_9ASCO|nr:uncharacterized protein KGF57_000689 [Candida theae]KAI5966005.1 hypothetical protein KGF57_000689 [Candida theae]
MTSIPKSPTSSKIDTVSPLQSPSSHPPHQSPPLSPIQQVQHEDSEQKLDTDQQQPSQQTPSQTKKRKPQTAEEYAHQLDLWRSSGPQINTESWLYEDVEKLNPIESKVDSAKLLHACEKAYYLRDWEKCLSLCNLGARLFDVDLDEVGDAMKQDLQSTSRRKRLGKKHERSVVDLYDIKQRCLSRMKVEQQ